MIHAQMQTLIARKCQLSQFRSGDEVDWLRACKGDCEVDTSMYQWWINLYKSSELQTLSTPSQSANSIM